MKKLLKIIVSGLIIISISCVSLEPKETSIASITKYNECKKRLETTTLALEDCNVMLKANNDFLDKVNKKNKVTKIKWFMIGTGTGALIGIIIYSLTNMKK